MKKPPLQFLGFLVGAIAVLLMAVMPRTQAHSIEQANTFGQIIALPGHINDVALDEVRQLVYAGNFSAGRVEVISMTTNQRISQFPTSPQPSAMAGMAMSLDARFLVAINVPVTSSVSQLSSITVINLNDSTNRRHFPLADTPLAVTFVTGGDALIVTTGRLLLFDPEDGSTRVLIDLENPPEDVILPVPLPTFPREVVTASVATSADGKWVYGLTDEFLFVYQVFHPTGLLSFRLTQGLVSSPVFNEVSVSGDGQYAMMAQLLVNRRLRIVADTPEVVTGDGLVGAHAIDSEINTVYVVFDTAAEFQVGPGQHPVSGVLQLMDLDNLLVRKRIRVTQRLTGPMALDSTGGTMYGVSESGLLHMPLNRLSDEPQLEFHPDDQVIFEQFDSCNRQPAVHTLRVESAGGSPARFELSVDEQRSSGRPAVLFEPDVGFTPADVKVTIDPGALGPVQGTSTFPINIVTNAVNIPLGGIVQANVVSVDQKGTLYPVPGTFVDVVADPYRDRFYVLDQANFRLLVFDADFRVTGSFRTGNTPTSMIMTQDGTSLLVANSQSETITWIDLNLFINRGQIFFPWRILGDGHYPRSIAVDSTNIMISAQSGRGGGVLAFLDMRSRIISVPDTLGIFNNRVSSLSGLAGTPDGRGILIAEPTGAVSFFEAQTFRIVLSRDDLPGLQGAVAAGPDYFLVDNHVLDPSLVEIGTFDDAATGQESSGFTLHADGTGVRSIRPRFQVDSGALQDLDSRDPTRVVNPVRMVEPPPEPTPFFPFTRSLATLRDGRLVSTSSAGVVEFPVGYGSGLLNPRVSSITNAADYSILTGAGGLISIWGENLAPETAGATSMPLPTRLADVCVTVNGANLPLLYVSPTQINGQLQFAAGTGNTVVHTPGGLSNTFISQVFPSAPAIFEVKGPNDSLFAAVFREDNQLTTLSAPLRPGEIAVIYLTGLGFVSPFVQPGYPAAEVPLSETTVQPQVTFGGVPGGVIYSGLTPGFVGLYQINVSVPGSAPKGLQVPLTIDAGASTTVLVRIVE